MFDSVLKPDRYSEPSQRDTMECFAKIVKSYIYFPKAFYLCQDSEYAHLSISTHSRVEWPSAMYCIGHIHNPAIFRTLSIIVNSNIFTSYLDILSYIVAYLEFCVTLAYSEPYHIQNSHILRTLPYSEF